MTEARCACGAVGRVAPPDFGYGCRDALRPLMRWHGGRLGVDRVAVEDARLGVTACPVCQHRATAFVLGG